MPKQSPKGFEAEARDTVVKSGLTGVGAAVLAVTVFSPAGFGGVVGTSLASGLGLSAGAASGDDNVYAGLPAYPSPLSPQELNDIRSKLASTQAALEMTRAATEAKLENMRSLSQTASVSEFAPMPPVVAPAVAEIEQPARQEAPAPMLAANHRDRDLELAELLLAHENF